MSTARREGHIPWWGYPFAGLCILLPIVTLGGALPGAIGAGCAYGCIQLSRNAALQLGTRVAACIGLTMLCWVLGIGLIAGMVAMR